MATGDRDLIPALYGCVAGGSIMGIATPGSAPIGNNLGHVAVIISNEIRFGHKTPRPSFQYVDKGTMATIGRSAAVAWLKWIHLSGYMAWLKWLFMHLVFLIGFRNRIAVLIN
jgi:NADH dehydrogenase